MTEENRVIEVLSKSIVQTVKKMLGDYDQDVASKLKNIKISGDNILPLSIDNTKIRDGSIDIAKIQNLSAQVADLVVANIKVAKIDTAQIRDLEAYLITAANAVIQQAEIEWAKIAYLQSAVAEITQASIGKAKIDFAQIYDLVAEKAVITKGETGKLYVADLAVTEANIVSLAVGQLMLKKNDGTFVQLVVDNEGEITTEEIQVENDNIADATLTGGKIALNTVSGDRLIAGTITARELNVQSIFADEALIGAITANNIAAGAINTNHLEAGSITTNKLASDVGANLDLSSNQSVSIKVATEVEEAVGEAIGYRIEVRSTSDILSSSITSTTLTAYVYKGKNEVTDTVVSKLYWTRISSDSTADAIWNENHKGIKSITLTTKDVYYSANYVCSLVEEDE